MIKPVVVVSGPTGAGKSDLAIYLARFLGGEIISVDSLQVYRSFDIGSAKCKAAAQKGVPHHLIDILDPDERYTVGRFVDDTNLCIDRLLRDNKLPILCGGTTLYLSSLLSGLSELPKANDKLRSDLNRLASDELHAELLRIDPISASRLHKNDRVRVIRAIEIFQAGGNTLSSIAENKNKPALKNPALIIAVMWDRDALYERINSRTKRMLEIGLLAETKSILEKWGNEAPGLSALGYSECVKLLSGNLAPDELLTEIAKNTRRYAKRQMTFWRNEPCKRGWIVRPEDALDPIFSKMDGKDTIRFFGTLDYTLETLLDEVLRALTEGISTTQVWYVNGELLG